MFDELGHLGEPAVVVLLAERLQLRLLDLLYELEQVFGHLVNVLLAVACVIR